jgi:inorganic pyrophosphatase
VLIERLQHYFSTYKMVPGEKTPIQVNRVYERDHALKVVMAAMADYRASFPG